MYEWCLKGVNMAQPTRIVFVLSMLQSRNKIINEKNPIYFIITVNISTNYI